MRVAQVKDELSAYGSAQIELGARCKIRAVLPGGVTSDLSIVRLPATDVPLSAPFPGSCSPSRRRLRRAYWTPSL